MSRRTSTAAKADLLFKRGWVDVWDTDRACRSWTHPELNHTWTLEDAHQLQTEADAGERSLTAAALRGDEPRARQGA